MKAHPITVKETQNPTILKFETDILLTKGKNYEFHNIDEAKDSPLAQQLFYLPFIKTVYISGNFIALERFDIVDWNDVREEVAEQLEAYINAGEPVIREEGKPGSNVPITIYAEVTPNPAVMRFVANRPLVGRIHEFKNIDEAKHAPLALKLFHLPFVKEVFMDGNYVSITKYEVAEWEEVAMELREIIRSFLADGHEAVTQEAPSTTSSSPDKNPEIEVPQDATSQEIIAILEEYVKPAVASDGGNILFQSYEPESKTVNVILQGACSGCPSSTFTLKNGIETMLRNMMGDRVQEVVALNG